MSKTILLAALSLVAVSASAAPTLIAQSVTSGGMMGPNPRICMGHELSVYSDGKVVTTECGKKPVLLLTLNKDLTARLAGIAAHPSSGGAVEVLDPSKPECNDAPSTTISLVLPSGYKDDIGGVTNCREVARRWDDRVYHFEAVALGVVKGLDEVAEFAH